MVKHHAPLIYVFLFHKKNATSTNIKTNNKHNLIPITLETKIDLIFGKYLMHKTFNIVVCMQVTLVRKYIVNLKNNSS